MPHPLERFRYCPVCGSVHFAEHTFKSKKCSDCGFEFFLNPSAATAAFILNTRNELLVTRRKFNPAKGTLDLPGGFSDIGESSEEGIAREISEETGMTITSCRFLFSLPNTYLYSGMIIPTLDMFYQCTVSDGVQPVPADDVSECQWLPLSGIIPDEFGLASIRNAVIRFLNET